MRLRNNPLAEDKLRASNFLITNFPFKLNKKITLELGMGKGEMITQMAQENLQQFFIGIEKYPTIAYYAAKRAKLLKLENFKIATIDIKDITSHFKGKVDTIWLTFSDPWPKARHSKRRLTHPNFLSLYTKLLTSEGVLKLKTDNDKFFNYSVESLKAENWELITITRDLHNDNLNKSNIMTGYEKKWSQQGKNINFLIARYQTKKK